MKSSHTPGPWNWNKERDQVASNHPDWEFSLICKIATGEDRKQEDANARLIAAAPELLEACKAARELVKLARQYFPKSVSNSDTFNLLNVDANTIAKAISKAEGN